MKILVIHATAGAGHQKAAEAVTNALKKYTGHEIVCVDALDYTSPAFKKLYCKSYFFLVSKVPLLWQIFFGFLDWPIAQPLMWIGRRIYNGINAGKLHRYLIQEQFDWVISTHFMPIEVVSALKQTDKIKSKLIACVTDFDVHRIWLGSGVDCYAVATEWSKRKIVRMGVHANKVFVTGIPTDEKFATPKNVGELKYKLGVEAGRFTALVATGSFGIGPIEDIIKAVPQTQFVVICGHGEKLYKALMEKKYPNARVFGLVNNMDEMMAVSDVMVTKPGGLSISEALVVGLPMIFFSAIPGQETNNIKVLSTFGIGAGPASVSQIVQMLDAFQKSPEKLSAAKERIKSMAHQNSVKEIVELIR
ncbi:MAG: hypothetical protein HQL26_09480 [Candidatus Omnitrophica bacterium]|nr:hypothetical protein [Candidatus Omnitrophota bacterium]